MSSRLGVIHTPLQAMQRANRPARSQVWLAGALWACVLYAAALCAAGTVGSATPDSAGEGAVSVHENHFLRDERLWIARGVTLLALVAPDTSTPNTALERARRQFGPRRT